MTATAAVLQPLDADPYGLELPDLAPAGPNAPSSGERPYLQVLPGGGAGVEQVGSAPDLEAPAPRAESVEVYRRRRFLVALALTLVILAATQAFGISLTSFGTPAGADDSAPVVHVVRPGDTYPTIAASLGVDDPQVFAVELQRSNGGGDLVVGQRLLIERTALG